MCYHPMRVKSVSQTGSMFTYIPCGKCEECRSQSKHSWSFRLQAELQYRSKLGWSCGFITLTYSPEHLPMLNQDLFDDPAARDMPCFDRQQVRDYVCSVRKWLHRHYRVNQLVYMVCSEYGKKGRPHYHMLVSWPPSKCVDKTDLGNRPTLDGYQMHRVLRHFWKYGFVFPQYHQGGFDGTYYHKPFELSDVVSFAAKYASKYCCKDINFANELSHHKIIEECCLIDELKVSFQNSRPFHIQSRSLGWSLIRDMSDDEKLKLLEVGYNFIGSDSFENIPLYIRNKLYFSPSYIVSSDGRRLVRRDASAFLLENYARIFSMKVHYYAELLERMCKPDFWQSRRIDDDKSRYFSSVVSERFISQGKSFEELATEYVAWFGVWPQNAYDIDPALQWLSRYTDYWYYVDLATGELKHDDGLPTGNVFDELLSRSPLKSIDFVVKNDEFWCFVFDTLRFTNGWMHYHDDVESVADAHRKYLDEEYIPIYTVERPLLA